MEEFQGVDPYAVIGRYAAEVIYWKARCEAAERKLAEQADE